MLPGWRRGGWPRRASRRRTRRPRLPRRPARQTTRSWPARPCSAGCGAASRQTSARSGGSCGRSSRRDTSQARRPGRSAWNGKAMTRSTSEKKTSDLRPQASGAALLLVILSACAGGKDAVDITKPVTGAEANNATRAYEKGLEEKKSQNFLEATRYFEWVRNNFPYSQYAALAELSLADMTYERDDYASAAAAYQDFVKSHPSHPKADYAAFRVGLAHYQDRPSDFFLLPPSSEKDESPIKAALDALNRFVISYPKSEYITKARDLIHDCRERRAGLAQRQGPGRREDRAAAFPPGSAQRSAEARRRGAAQANPCGASPCPTRGHAEDRRADSRPAAAHHAAAHSAAGGPATATHCSGRAAAIMIRS